MIKQTFFPDATLWATAKSLAEREGALLSAWVADAAEQYAYRQIPIRMSGGASPIPGKRDPKQAQFIYSDELYAACKGAAAREGRKFNTWLESALATKVLHSIGQYKFRALYRGSK